MNRQKYLLYVSIFQNIYLFALSSSKAAADLSAFWIRFRKLRTIPVFSLCELEWKNNQAHCISHAYSQILTSACFIEWKTRESSCPGSILHLHHSGRKHLIYWIKYFPLNPDQLQNLGITHHFLIYRLAKYLWFNLSFSLYNFHIFFADSSKFCHCF